LRQAADWRMRDYVASRAVSWPKATLEKRLEEFDLPDQHCDSRTEHQSTLAEALDRLDASSRWLLQARFGFGPFTKRQSLGTIAAQLHLSEKQVSRRIKALCERLRGELS
jgi:DNA-directed RNA polymerase specialized sigma subunit